MRHWTLHVRTTQLVALGLLLSACTGPREPLQVGVREVASNIVMGSQGPKTPPMVAPPIPPAPVAVAFPTPVNVPTTSVPTVAPKPSTTPVEDPCPVANPLSVPRHPVTSNDGAPPVAESFTFMNDGAFRVAGANAAEGVFDQDTVRRVENVDGGPGQDVTYDVVAELGGTVTTSSYLLRNLPVVDDGLGIVTQAGLDDQRGLFVTEVASILPDGTASAPFRPAAPMRLLRFPLRLEDTFDEVGTDPLTGTVMRWTATVIGPAKVDACGLFIDTVEIHLSDGEVTGPGQSVTFSATYWIAPQYGGLIVQDSVVTSGTELGSSVTRTNVARITGVPTHHSEVDE